MRMHSRLRPGIVVLLVVIAIYAVPIRWIESRRLIPLDAPVSVSNGHFQTGNFKINLDAVYVVSFERPVDATSDVSACAQRARLRAKWTVFKNGKPIFASLPSTSLEAPSQRVDWFRAGSGTYSINVEVLPGADCLNVVPMRLMVWAYDADFSDALHLLWSACVFLGGIGIVLLIRSDPASFHDEFAGQRSAHPGISQSFGYARNFGSRKRRPIALFHSLPNFGMFYFVSVFPAMIAMMILTMPSPSMGLKIHLVRPSGFNSNMYPRSEPLLVWLDARGNYFINEKQISRNDLGDALKHELSQRAEWTVYFEADPNAQFGDAVFAIGEIRNASGKLVWLTPKTRSEFSSLKPVQ